MFCFLFFFLFLELLCILLLSHLLPTPHLWILCFLSKTGSFRKKKNEWFPTPRPPCSLIYLSHILFKQILLRFLEGLLPLLPSAKRIWHQLKNLVVSHLSIPCGICYSTLQSGDLFAPLVANNRPNFLSLLLLKTASLPLPGTIAAATLQMKKGAKSSPTPVSGKTGR